MKVPLKFRTNAFGPASGETGTVRILTGDNELVFEFLNVFVINSSGYQNKIIFCEENKSYYYFLEFNERGQLRYLDRVSQDNLVPYILNPNNSRWRHRWTVR